MRSSGQRRVAKLMFAGLVDSFCLSLGWTVVMLQVVADYGLAAAGVVSAAMLVGVAISAPVASRLARLLGGRQLLRSAALVEAVLRVAVFVLLVGRAPVPVLALCVAAMNITAWTGYAGMRAEVAAASPGTSALTWYGTGVAAIEACGAACGALLPMVADVRSSTVLAMVTVVYVLGLVPTAVVAGGSPILRLAIPQTPPVRVRRPPRMSLPVVAGVVLMFAASAPTLLAVGLAAELHGRASVAFAAGAFTLGSLAAPFLASRVQRRNANGPVAWLLCAFGMMAGWALAPMSVVLLLVAQAASGLFMTSLEGMLDTSTASRAGGAVTGALARATAGRALGSAAATAVLPGAVTWWGISATAVVISVVLVVAALAVRGARRVPRVGVEPTLDGV